MLKYQLGKQVFDNDTVTLKYNTINVTDYDGNEDMLMVELECDDVSFVEYNHILTFTGRTQFYNQGIDDIDYVGYNGTINPFAINYLTNSIYFITDKYTESNIKSISAEVKDNIVTWLICFEKPHFFAIDTTPDFYLRLNDGTSIHLNNEETTFVVDCNQISWVYDATVENAQYISDVVFGFIDPSIDGVIDGNAAYLTCVRNQIIWTDTIDNENQPTVTVNLYKVSLTVPISIKSNTDLCLDGNIEEYFVDYEKQKAINAPIEMEKYVYTPVVVSKILNGAPIFEDCMKINFNLHFRAHDGDDWTVNDSDSWNFEKYGDYNNWGTNKYYSYTPSPTSPTDSNKWKRSCQADLLGYLGFTTNDVKYQKNKLKKSFIRLFYYDSNNPATQSLLGYSTIFMDCNKLYSKFISKANFECYYDDNGEIVKGIKSDREVSVNDLAKILKWSGMTTEEIEDYRLSSQISVKNKYLSDNSSEGFYLYKWEGEDEANTPNDLYLKVEFNHAGYGRIIPMMAPYKDGYTVGFKTNEEIINDWSNPNTQYGIKKYSRYSYIHLKTKYDTNTNRRIYYLDPDTYGVNKDGNIININLYESRISFNN